MSDTRPPPPKHEPPKGEPQTWTLEELKKHCLTATILELHTIPIYLYSAYCIKSEAVATFRKIIGVVKQEMLHLGLAGNILAAIGGTPTLYGLKSTPEYPCQIFYDPIDLHLMPPNQDAIESFVRLEAPTEVPDRPRGNILPGYPSIGAFYESLKRGIKTVHDQMAKEGKALFDPQYTDRQFTPDDGSYGDEMTQIKTLDDALNAMELIIEQGEGTQVTTPAAPGQETSHWQIFQSLLGADIPHYDTVQDPKVDDPSFSDNIKTAMRAFDAVYCYLLLSIENVWANVSEDNRNNLLSNIDSMMRGMLQPIAKFLVTQKVNDTEGSKYAAPPFNFYNFDSVDSAKDEMIQRLTEAKEAYPTGPFASQITKAKNLFDLKDLNN
ncbi:unnamed protein product [Rhizoctonia solani]|uniref:Iminophenyl-pyruvate dimer synthase domain-containing protein n=1 Tax=Rhizoctonia solani TaxID=456999 RepID=A0A8H3HPN7_9AGAM|nr:unnamed protein product [Rhizoctonia solani]